MSLRLKIHSKIPNMIVHWMDSDEIWSSSNYTLLISKNGGKTYDENIELDVPQFIRTLGKYRLIARTFRMGIRDLRKLKSGTIIIIANKKIFRLRNNKINSVHSFQGLCLGPLRNGWCEDQLGNCYLGEYLPNIRRNKQVRLLKSTNDGQSWEIIRSLKHIRHIHFVQYDPFSDYIWMGTGDRDSECSISYSEDGGKTWTKIGSGSQKFRALSLILTENYIYWGTDTPNQQSYIYRYKRKSGKIERMFYLSGPAYYSKKIGNVMLMSTTVENNRGSSNRAHIWASKDGLKWFNLASWEKDRYPFIFGFGTILFAHGNCSKNVAFTPRALKYVDNVAFHASLVTS